MDDPFIRDDKPEEKMHKYLLFKLLIVIHLYGTGLYAQSHTHGIADMTLNAFLGGSSDPLWHSADSAIQNISTESVYRVYTLFEELPPALCTEILFREENGPTEPSRIVLTPEPVSDQPVIAIGGSWNALPRTPHQYEIVNPYIMKDITRIFEEYQLNHIEPRITESYQIDLEGDGEEEWLLVLTNQSGEVSPHAKKDDYAIALLGKWIDSHPMHFVILSEIHQNENEWRAPSRFSIRAILDANGDGTQEIFIYTRNYEAGVTSIHEYHDGAVYERLRAGWGN